jgi:transposase
VTSVGSHGLSVPSRNVCGMSERQFRPPRVGCGRWGCTWCGARKVDVHRSVVGRVKTIQVKRCGRRWMLVLSCDDVPANPLPAAGRQAGIDVKIARFATTSDGEHVENPRFGRAAADKLAAAQQRLQRAKRRSKNPDRKRETVAVRHRKIANQRNDFHHKQVRALVARYDLLVVEDLRIANMLHAERSLRRHAFRQSPVTVRKGNPW